MSRSTLRMIRPCLQETNRLLALQLERLNGAASPARGRMRVLSFRSRDQRLRRTTRPHSRGQKWRIWSPSAGTFLAFFWPWALVGPASTSPARVARSAAPGHAVGAQRTTTCRPAGRCDEMGRSAMSRFAETHPQVYTREDLDEQEAKRRADRLRASVRADLGDADDRGDRLAGHGPRLGAATPGRD